MSAKAKFKYFNTSGNAIDGEVNLEDYRIAQDAGMTLTQFVNLKYADADARYGTAFEQAVQNVGIRTKSDPSRGIQASTIKSILDGTVMAQMVGEQLTKGGAIVSPSTQGTTPASRIFFPEVVFNLMNEVLQADYSQEDKIFTGMISNTETIATEMFTQPLINTEAPAQEDSMPMSQNALPRNLVSITTSQYAKSIATNSVGLQISDQAISHASIDLVGTILGRQTEGEKLRNMWSDISSVHAGNLDTGDAAITPVAASTLDVAATGGVMTQSAWLKMLYDPDRKIQIDSAIMDLDSYLAIEKRLGRPVIFDPTTATGNVGNLGNSQLNSEPNALNVQLGVANVLIVPTAYIGASTVLLFDSRFALRRVVNSSAAYSATEKMVLQRSNFFRFDWGRMTYRLFDDAFKLFTFT